MDVLRCEDPGLTEGADAIALLTSEISGYGKHLAPSLGIILRLESKDAVRVNGRLCIAEAANFSISVCTLCAVHRPVVAKLGNVITHS